MTSYTADGYPTVAPWVIVDRADDFIEFAQHVFGAELRFAPHYLDEEKTHVGHAELRIGDSLIMLFDRQDGWAPTPAFLNLYVPDADETHRRALDRGAVEVTRLATNAWGARGSRLLDPFGNLWWINTQVEDPSEEQMAERMEQDHYAEILTDAIGTLDRHLRDRIR
ncbi:VOC family protein [Actinomadura sp. 7K507]|uniref:VOC family protein n=1 Tax=Actinomadura sp. 7K507 TaxID=2530365 RepID=UPI00104C2AB5|nr:VOC family protein [Actinomadura sp. 7K507]TDC79301.1 VOC family protein [Actinomadura sp. 7K507]